MRTQGSAASPLRAAPGAENAALWLLWMTYGAFYFCRTNISAAVPGMERELGLSKTRSGWFWGG